MVVLANARVVTSRAVREPGWLRVTGTRIAAVGRGDPPTDDEVVDLAGGYLLPGFIDLHMHGGGGAQVTTDDPDEIARAVAFHRRHGTTRTLASLVTDELDRMAAALRAIAGLVRSGTSGVVGSHLDGPFRTPARRGSPHRAYHLAPT